MKGAPKLNVDNWVDAYGDALFRFARARVKDRPTAEDLVQETFLAAMRSRERYRGTASEKTWLFSILKHKVVDHYRKNKARRQDRLVLHEPDNPEAFFDAGGQWRIRPENWRTNPVKSQENKEFLDYFYRCLSELPGRTADVFVFREIDGMRTAEICERLGITSSNCWVILYRARMLLRRCLDRFGFGERRERRAP